METIRKQKVIEIIVWIRICLTPKQTECIYKKVELGSLINKNTVKEETNPDIELDKIDNNSEEENPYRELIVIMKVR